MIQSTNENEPVTIHAPTVLRPNLSEYVWSTSGVPGFEYLAPSHPARMFKSPDAEVGEVGDRDLRAGP